MSASEFCEARICEDEAAARAVSTWVAGAGFDPVFRHIYRHAPERVLRRCAAERALLAGSPQQAGILAGTWSDHPDYDPSWDPAWMPGEPAESVGLDEVDEGE